MDDDEPRGGAIFWGGLAVGVWLVFCTVALVAILRG